MAQTDKKQLTAALNTLINLSLQIAREQQAQVQNAVNVLVQALDLDEEAPPSEDPADHVEKDQFRSDAEADADALASAGQGTDEDYGGTDEKV
jgi:hypothetical protein